MDNEDSCGGEQTDSKQRTNHSLLYQSRCTDKIATFATIMVKASEIAKFLNKQITGEDCMVMTHSSLSSIQPFSLVFAKKFSKEYVALLNSACNVFAIVTPDYKNQIHCSHILSETPRLDYLKTVERFFSPDNLLTGISPSATIENDAVTGADVFIGAHCYIGHNVKIGERTKILPNTTIMENTIIGRECYISSGVVIGQPGFGFERDENGRPVHFPHTGNVVIGNNVYIGANTAIDKGTIDSTVIEDNVKIDNLVHVAHNVHICEGAFIIAGTILGGGVRIGRNAWVAPNVSVKQQLNIGDNSTVGLGAVVIRDVGEDETVIGNPARKLEKLK